MTDGSTIGRILRRLGSWALEEALASVMAMLVLIGGVFAAFWFADRRVLAWIIIGALIWIAIIAIVFAVKRSR